MLKKIIILAAIVLVGIAGYYAYTILNKDITLTDAKIVTGIDDKLMPLKAINVFPRGTSKVSCWFGWRDARINTQILAKWHYVTDDVHILDYDFNIPKKEGMGSVTLTMPEGKTLPQGSYKVDLILNKRFLRSLTFRVE